ncbi:YlaC family protein [Serratia sp. AKBS12]|uniref:YlaC family protein n=1 Tax=Serratia sp. AKBS12 TaxID=2974597 RepID=UPI002165B718|nr:YlaC family protein [Serratia sp. AKBS12]MCS3409085.1 YlaC family protein [Serratia sp. AKBS12]HEI8865412.1 YlaC family protein [Serratia odorifera]
MDAIKNILLQEIDHINQQEGRDGKPRFNSEFARTHRYLCLAMFAGYFAVIAVMYPVPYLGLWSLIGFTAFVLFMFAMLLVEIKPVYRFEDIGVLDLRVCYNGEWYFTRALSAQAVAELLAEPTIGMALKARVQEILANKGEIDFYDVYDLAYGKKLHNPGTPVALVN